MNQMVRRFILTMILALVAVLIALPPKQEYNFSVFGKQFQGQFGMPALTFSLWGNQYGYTPLDYRRGLDIQGGVQVVLQADMTEIPEEDRIDALESASQIITRRVDQFGITEPTIRTSISGESYRILVELPGANDVDQALALVGTTAQLDFKLLRSIEASGSAQPMTALEDTGLSGKQLKRASVQFDPQTGEPVVAIEFNQEGSELFTTITTQNTGELLGIMLDQSILMAPRINTPIVGGRAEIRGGFTAEQAKQLSIQLNAGALPVPIAVIEQRTVGASLGIDTITRSIQAGLIGLLLVILFLILNYGFPAFLATISLFIYVALVMAIYKIIGVTLTMPSITGLLLSTAMAVDAMILIFERYKEEVRAGRAHNQALHQAFGRAWTSIKDANIATTITALVLINPFNFTFLNTGGVVRGFGVTLLIGILVGLFSGVVVIRTLMLLFLSAKQPSAKETLFAVEKQDK